MRENMGFLFLSAAPGTRKKNIPSLLLKKVQTLFENRRQFEHLPSLEPRASTTCFRAITRMKSMLDISFSNHVDLLPVIAVALVERQAAYGNDSATFT